MARLPEQILWDNFKRASVGARYKLYRIENLLGAGMPDVLGKNHLHGTVFFLENKAILSWPKRESTLPLKTKFKPKQLPFAREWNSHHGHCFVLLRAGEGSDDEWLLLKETINSPSLDSLTKDGLFDCAIICGRSEIIEFLENLR